MQMSTRKMDYAKNVKTQLNRVIVIHLSLRLDGWILGGGGTAPGLRLGSNVHTTDVKKRGI
jgi:hypothetical protein